MILNKFISEGYTAFLETNGDDGLKNMRTNNPDLVLLDIGIPGKNGYEVLEEVHNDLGLKHIPIIIISNSGQPIEIAKVTELGAKDYIVKANFSPKEVLEKVHAYLGDGKVAATETSQPANHTETNGVASTNSGPKVLIIEDDLFLSTLSGRRLKNDGYKVSFAHNATEAIQSMESEVPDLMLLDIIMPGTNGFELLKKIKSDRRYNNVAIIVFSNLGQEHEIEEGKKLGADEFLVKANVTPKELAEKIHDLLVAKGKIK